MPTAEAKPGKLLLSPGDHTLILIDHQPQMAFATKSIDRVALRNNPALISKAAQEFGVSTILTTVAARTFSGPIFPEITQAFPEAEIIDRTTMNTWEDLRIAVAVNKNRQGPDRVRRAVRPACASWAPPCQPSHVRGRRGPLSPSRRRRRNGGQRCSGSVPWPFHDGLRPTRASRCT